MEDLEVVTVRLRKGDREALATYFAPIPYNKALRGLVSKVVDTIRERGAASASAIEVDLSKLED